MYKTVKEIAELVGGVVEGDNSVVIKGVCGIKEAKEGDITFLANSKYIGLMKTTGEKEGFKRPSISLIKPILNLTQKKRNISHMSGYGINKVIKP